MPDKQLATEKEMEQELSQHTRHLLEVFGSQMHDMQIAYANEMTDMLRTLPLSYQALVRNTIAERLVNTIKVHFLSIAAKLYHELGASEMWSEVVEDTLAETRELMQMNNDLLIRSLDDLLNLGNITAGLYDLSQVESKDDAERWMYKLPALYRMKLQEIEILQQKKALFSLVIEQENVNFVVNAHIEKSSARESTENNQWNRFLLRPNESAASVVDTSASTVAK